MWHLITIGVVACSLPLGFTEPTALSGGLIYTIGCSLATSDGAATHDLWYAELPKASTDAQVDVVQHLTAGATKNYVPGAVISWDQNSTTSIKRIAFTWGDHSEYTGWNWILMSAAQQAVVTLFSRIIDDGVSSGIEYSLAFVGA